VVAQGRVAHAGFYIGAGLGGGWARVGGDFSDATEFGYSGSLRLGGHAKPNLLIGGETNGWYKSADAGGVNTSWMSLMVTTSVYPGKDLPLFVKAGLGGMLTTGRIEGFGSYTSARFAIQVGAGFDIKIGRSSAVNIMANWIQGFSGQIDWSNSSAVGNASPSIIQLGVGFSLY
jgi:hypothetical protein